MSCGKPCECESYAQHLRSIGFSSTGMPTRMAHVQAVNATEADWDRDMPAYKRLRADGLQPHRIDGCAAAEKAATTREQIEGTPTAA